MAQVAVVFGGPSPEHDISILTGLQAARLVGGLGHSVTTLYWSKSGRWTRVPLDVEARDFLEGPPRGGSDVEFDPATGFVERRRMRASGIAFDAVLNCCHGGPGEDGTLSAMLQLAGLRVTGPRPSACATAMDKLATTAIAEMYGIPTIPTTLYTGTDDELPPPPWVVKPRFGGSSIGVEAGVEDAETVRGLAQHGVSRAGVLVQPMLAGWHDVNVSVRTHPHLQVSAAERPLREENQIYDYSRKYLSGGNGVESAPRELPAVLPTVVLTQIRTAAEQLTVALGLTGAPRIDFLWDGHDRVVLCEVNSIPGAWGTYLWQATGVTREQFFADLVGEALQGPGSPPEWAATSDGRALRHAGSIAAKLA